ncbi:hypothetical protein ACFLUE_00780 [Chloroflexota bacterium]
MGLIGLIVSIIAAVFLFVGLIPFLGWLNWFTTIPVAVLAIILSGIATTKSPRSGMSVAGLIISLAVLAVALVRLLLGGGIL